MSGRLVDALDDLGVLEDTLVYYIDRRQRLPRRGNVNGPSTR
jgi:hypothetical protein